MVLSLRPSSCLRSQSQRFFSQHRCCPDSFPPLFISEGTSRLHRTHPPGWPHPPILHSVGEQPSVCSLYPAYHETAQSQTGRRIWNMESYLLPVSFRFSNTVCLPSLKNTHCDTVSPTPLSSFPLSFSFQILLRWGLFLCRPAGLELRGPLHKPPECWDKGAHPMPALISLFKMGVFVV